MNIISLPQGGGSNGGGSASLFAFPLSIQDEQPTPEAKGHIWITPSNDVEKADKMYIVDALSKDLDDNSIVFVVSSCTRNLELNISTSLAKKVSDTNKIYETHYNYSNGVTDWVLSDDEEGNSMKIKKPLVYVKKNGYYYMVTSKMWNGEYWEGLSNKDLYLLHYVGLSFSAFNIISDGNNSSLNKLSFYNRAGIRSGYNMISMAIVDEGSIMWIVNSSDDGRFILAVDYDANKFVIYEKKGEIFELIQSDFLTWNGSETYDGYNIRFYDATYETTTYAGCLEDIRNPWQFDSSGEKIYYITKDDSSSKAYYKAFLVEFVYKNGQFVFNKLYSFGESGSYTRIINVFNKDFTIIGVRGYRNSSNTYNVTLLKKVGDEYVTLTNSYNFSDSSYYYYMIVSDDVMISEYGTPYKLDLENGTITKASGDFGTTTQYATPMYGNTKIVRSIKYPEKYLIFIVGRGSEFYINIYNSDTNTASCSGTYTTIQNNVSNYRHNYQSIVMTTSNINPNTGNFILGSQGYDTSLSSSEYIPNTNATNSNDIETKYATMLTLCNINLESIFENDKGADGDITIDEMLYHGITYNDNSGSGSSTGANGYYIRYGYSTDIFLPASSSNILANGKLKVFGDI
jgi:hypothetical protein